MTTPTTNPVPSSAAADLLFNAEKLDEAVNGSSASYIDRKGVSRLTLAGAIATTAQRVNRGEWATLTVYALGDVAQQSGTWYLSLVAHTAGTFATDLATGRWGVYQGVVETDLAGTGAGQGAEMIGTRAGNTVEQRLGTKKTTAGTTIQAAVAALVTGDHLLITEDHTITATLTIPTSHVTIELAPGVKVRTATPNISIFEATGKTGIKICSGGTGGTSQTVWGATLYVGHIRFDNCTRCSVIGLDLEGAQWSGVLLNNSIKCTVVGNRIGAMYAAALPDQADIHVYRNSSDNLIAYNLCEGNSRTGIHLQDPWEGTLPARNQITHNRVATHKSYGIINYVPHGTFVPLVTTPAESHNHILNNYIENITGDPAVQVSTGMAIYSVGAGTGGVRIEGNVCENSCSLTNDDTNGTACITLADHPDIGAQATVLNNLVLGVAQSHGIRITGSSNVQEGGNTIRLTAANDGTGPGGGTLRGNGLYIVNSANVQRTLRDDIQVLGTGGGIKMLAQNIDCSSIDLGDGTKVETAGGNGIEFDYTGAGQFSDARVGGHAFDLPSASAFALVIRRLVRGVVEGSRGVIGTTAPAGVAWLYMRDCTETVVDSNRIKTFGTEDLNIDGTNTGSLVTRTNLIAGSVSNAGSGCIVERYGDAAPTAGTARIGDTVIRRTPVVGQPRRWRATAAGSPGTWTSEGNL